MQGRHQGWRQAARGGDEVARRPALRHRAAVLVSSRKTHVPSHDERRAGQALRTDLMALRHLLTIVGPTGIGKTSVGVSVASRIGGEIISADSRQIYRGMDVGTAKPTPEEREAAAHHLVDIVDPWETYDAVRFASDAEDVAWKLLASGVEPIVVGGTGFYIRSLFEGLFEGPGRNEEVRDRLEERLASEGSSALHEELRRIDPGAAGRLHPNDGARVVRALEVYISTGETLSSWQTRRPRKPAFAPRYFGLTMPRDQLYARIEQRVDRMIEEGLLDEIRELLRSGRLSAEMPGATAVGYRELLPVAAGGTSDLEAAVELVKRNTRRYAKRQMTWFSSVPDVTWIDLAETGPDEAAARIADG
ncbi:MAG: tRNA (adenosine(37)-N6)-dimethylallyltransferase MiaA [Candidatus Eisenbacteria bacterium]|nr:tRNA (adenosine(37)-N6)-dimethylallyltransferase MiaA [Candidatus Eisenbacteria bacterium]